MTPPASRIGPLRLPTRGRILLAALAALCWTVLPTAYGARAEDPVTLSRQGQVTDRSGAATGAADGHAAVLAGSPVHTTALAPDRAGPGSDDRPVSGADVTLVLPLTVAAVVLSVAGYAWLRRRHRTTTRTTPALPGRGGSRPGADGRIPLAGLDARTGADLVDTDDAVRTSEEELGFAVARYGEEAAAPFIEAVAHAEAQLTAAFRLRQRLDDASPEDDAEHRRMLEEIVRRCSDADARLDAVAGDFDRLRALEETAPEAVAAAESTFQELLGRVSTAEATLGGMRERYAPSAYAPVAGAVERAQDRLVFATSCLGQARRAVDGGGRAEAAVRLRAVEGALAQASTLVDGVERRAAELAEADSLLPGALTGADTDLADARGLLEGTGRDVPQGDLRGRVARAEAVLGAVREGTRSGPYDPIDALRRVREADMAPAGTREHGDRRARALLEQSLLTARSAIGAAADCVGTHRGAVGSQARTRLAEARCRWEAAREWSEANDPRAALAEARQADALAGQALGLAEQDVRAYRDAHGPSAGGGVDGAVLGGILLGGLFGGGGGDGDGGGLGGRGFSGGPGSFGGGGTRGRRGGGRF
ncbi:TPM domain-containing protein [Streptomyces sp. NPDC058330]|uniref:TPM domain-containing protein n=1 Tax=Streptomyces sp. NPDC058330 TaxID=3346449 RepID=UPI0036E71FD2